MENNIFLKNYIGRKSVEYIDIGQQKLQMLKNFYIFNLKNFVFTLVPLRIAQQSINSFISLMLPIIDIKIVAKQLLRPVNLKEA